MSGIAMTRAALLFGVATLASAHLEIAHAQVSVSGFVTGNDLLARCKSGNIYSEGVCLGYIEGVIDSMIGVRAVAGREPCPPGGEQITAKQVEDVVLNALALNPAKRHFSAASLVITAISDAWHCR